VPAAVSGMSMGMPSAMMAVSAPVAASGGGSMAVSTAGMAASVRVDQCPTQSVTCLTSRHVTPRHVTSAAALGSGALLLPLK
jgi:hypothetical protein